VNGVSRHVQGYLDDFLFPPDRARSPVKALSGGERNRLLLARLFTRPSNVLVLDEPTNDLDLETLELLEARLVEYPGTILLVSHDRAFLDNVVTSTFVFEGQGRIEEYVGGYQDWVRQRAADPSGESAAAGPQKPDRTPAATAATVTAPPRRRLGYNEQRELDGLPARIDMLEGQERRLDAAVADPGFYKEPRGVIEKTLAELESTRQSLLEAYARWDELESRR
jgi:ATP-binding cassette subfamily F protein uup